jgi:hypothetical protein
MKLNCSRKCCSFGCTIHNSNIFIVHLSIVFELVGVNPHSLEFLMESLDEVFTVGDHDVLSVVGACADSPVVASVQNQRVVNDAKLEKKHE